MTGGSFDSIFPYGTWDTLLALMDTVVPGVQRGMSGSTKYYHIDGSRYDRVAKDLKENTALYLTTSAEFDSYMIERPSQIGLFRDVLKLTLESMPADMTVALVRVLYLLNTRVGSLILTGRATPIEKLSIQERTTVLQGWSDSRLPQLRDLAKQMTILGRLMYLRTSTTFAGQTGFPEKPLAWHSRESFEYEMLQPPPQRSSYTYETDIVIIGSGCGAAVCAKRLAEAGHRVLVAEKGYHYSTSSFPMEQKDSFANLLDGGGVVGSDDGSIFVTSGSCFGGGGTVNWSASLQTQGFVRREWAEDHGISFFTSREFQNSLDRVCSEMGVDDGCIQPNHGNAVLLNGAKKLGLEAKLVPQNTAGHSHDDGYCALGCWTGEKQGPVTGWFPDAARNGARFIQGFEVRKVLFDRSNGDNVATGVTGMWTDREPTSRAGMAPSGRRQARVTINAKRVLICGGTLWSPVILMKSGVKNRNIGKNLYLHPVNMVSGFFTEDVRPWEGGILTSVVSSFENLDGKGHGVKLEATCMMPSFCLPFLNCEDGFAFKSLALKYRHMNTYISIARDRDSGHVYPDATSGRPRVVYTPSKFDRKHILRGLIETAKVLYTEGAQEIHPSLPGLRPFVRSVSGPASVRTVYNATTELEHDEGINDKSFQDWLRTVEVFDNSPTSTPFLSAHQMGTCRMSSTPDRGVVNPQGRVWGTKGLYVADASVFPSASGVNPMITTMAIADWISQNVAMDLQMSSTAAKL